jgi:hypothetical protein
MEELVWEKPILLVLDVNKTSSVCSDTNNKPNQSGSDALDNPCS